MMQVRIGQKTKNLSLLLLLVGCSTRLAPQTPAQVQEASFLAMGARWTVAMSGVPTRRDFTVLKDKLASFALHYEMVFSDWSEDSELRRLEKSGLTQTQAPSELFFEGLLLAQEAFGETAGVFDVTVGAIHWKAADTAVGLQTLHTNVQKKTFRFEKDPRRLSFGGLVKGMALGDMASYLIAEGVRGFSINAGGGNLVERLSSGQLRFVSRSRIYKAGTDGDRHIWHPKDARYVQERAEVICSVEERSRSQLIRWGGLSDAFSTARLLSHEFQLPPICEEV
jgi:hypothetical protein